MRSGTTECAVPRGHRANGPRGGTRTGNGPDPPRRGQVVTVAHLEISLHSLLSLSGTGRRIAPGAPPSMRRIRGMHAEIVPRRSRTHHSTSAYTIRTTS